MCAQSFRDSAPSLCPRISMWLRCRRVPSNRNEENVRAALPILLHFFEPHLIWRSFHFRGLNVKLHIHSSTHRRSLKKADLHQNTRDTCDKPIPDSHASQPGAKKLKERHGHHDSPSNPNSH